MLSRVLSFVLLCCLVLAGCAYRSAIERGHQLAMQQDYRGALAAYQKALALDPDDEDARRFVAQMTPFAVGAAEKDANQAIVEARFEDALKHARYAGGLDPKAGLRLSERVRDTMLAVLDAVMHGGKMVAAYDFAGRTRRMFYGDAKLEARLVKLRQHFYAASARLADAGRFAEALQSLDVVAKHEPDRRAEIEERRATLRVRWADTVVARARVELAAGHEGAAAALYGRAFEIAGRAADAGAMRLAGAKLRRQATFLMTFAEGQIDERTAALRASVDAALDKLGGIERPTRQDDGVTLIVAVEATSASCAEQSSTYHASKEYVSGYRDVPNPEYAALQSKLASHDATVASLAGQAASQRSTAQSLRGAAKRCQHSHVTPARTKLTQAEAAVQAAEAAVRVQRQVVAALEGKDDKALAAERAKLRALEDELRQARAHEQSARSAYQHAEHVCDSDRRRAKRAHEELARTESALAAERARADAVARQLQTTPTTVSEPVMATLTYPVKRVVKRCLSGATAELQPAWQSAETRQLSSAAIAQDDTHAAHPIAGVAADPLSLASDASLVAAADRQNAAKIAALLEAQVKSYYRDMAAKALALEQEEPHAATDMIVGMLMAAPKKLDKQTTARFARHLAERYGLARTETLQR